MLHDALSEAVIAAAFEVMNVLGPGFSERVYHESLHIELTLRGIHAQKEPELPVHYKNHPTGTFKPDLLVNHTLIVELKCTPDLIGAHLAQTLNYLKAANLHTALLLNFQNPKIQIKRLSL